MASFHKAHKKTQLIEGGYANNSLDRGGETYKGIARKFHADWKGWDIIDKEKLNGSIPANYIFDIPELEKLVNDFYKTKFWDVNNLDLIKSQKIAEELFDTGVNMGTRVAAKFLQYSLNLLGENLIVDGVIGRNTIKITDEYPFEDALLKTLNGLQFMRYVDIVENDNSQLIFFRGWLKRV